AAPGPVPTLDEVLQAFTRPPLDDVALNLDIKLPGREDEIVALVRDHDLVGRASISTMELTTLEQIGSLEPALRRGWTVPRVTRDWTSSRWMKPALTAGAAAFRRRLPRTVRAGIPRLGVSAVWAFHGIVTPRLVEVVQAAGAELNVWTVDDQGEVARFREMEVDGICSNDPRLLQPRD
ncbi:MAG: glycerophosphodiester phosphodiesterase, partial [Actinomycetota bacterium]|nr:glycerophosphodiester phosphodiesterase [Actinomycetota bacterium]